MYRICVYNFCNEQISCEYFVVSFNVNGFTVIIIIIPDLFRNGDNFFIRLFTVKTFCTSIYHCRAQKISIWKCLLQIILFDKII